jgi:hypothetical protein
VTDDELKSLLATNASENRRSFNETAERLSAENRHFFGVTADATRHAVSLVAENVAAVDERLTRVASEMLEEMRRGFTETQAMIKFSHDELHRLECSAH